MRAVAYVRVSTEQQADGGLSLDLQEAKLRAMAEVQDAELVEVLVDAGESAKSLRRPGMDRLLELVDGGEVDAVLVYKLDRLTRSVRDLGDLLERFERRGVCLVSVSESLDTGTAAGRLVLNVMASVAQWEREAIGERTAAALQEKRRQGKRAGTVPFGYTADDDGTLLPDREEQRLLSRMRRLRSSGHTLKAIAERLNRSGSTTRGGRPWTIRGVHHHLTA